MKAWKLTMVVFLLAAVVISSFGCSSDSDEVAAAQSQEVPVQRGDLTIDITGIGNLALSRTEDLAIDLFYQEGTIEEVLVEEGDTVEEGQALAKLDTDEWNDELSKLEKAVRTAQRNLTARENSLTKAERQVITLERQVTTKESAVTEAEREITAKELAVLQVDIDLQTAEYILKEINDVKKVQDAIDDAEYTLQFATNVLSGEFAVGIELDDSNYWYQLKAHAEGELVALEEDMEEILNGSSLKVSEDVALDVAKKRLIVMQKQLALEDAELAIEYAKNDLDDTRYALEEALLAVDDAKQAVEEAKLDVEDTRDTLKDAQETWEEAKGKSPVITAPFDGFITKVRVEGGDEIKTGTVAVEIADPDKFEAEVMVGETDIRQVKVGGEAKVQVDAMEGLSLPAKITHIAPTATIQQGVVNYRVMIEILSLEAVRQKQPEERQQGAQDVAPGEIPERLRQAIEEGRITEEEALERMQQRQSGRERPPREGQGGQQGGGQGRSPGEGQGRPPEGQPAASPESIQVREGLTVTVSIVVEERKGVLLVPNRAISRQGEESHVQVALSDGSVEERVIQTGISNWQFTEVAGGVREGENVLVTVTASTGVTQQQQKSPIQFIAPSKGGKGGGRK
jgi:multidrug resistance efflux pump